jgi:hypothetical protein
MMSTILRLIVAALVIPFCCFAVGLALILVFPLLPLIGLPLSFALSSPRMHAVETRSKATTRRRLVRPSVPSQAL